MRVFNTRPQSEMSKEGYTQTLFSGRDIRITNVLAFSIKRRTCLLTRKQNAKKSN